MVKTFALMGLAVLVAGCASSPAPTPEIRVVTGPTVEVPGSTVYVRARVCAEFINANADMWKAEHAIRDALVDGTDPYAEKMGPLLDAFNAAADVTIPLRDACWLAATGEEWIDEDD